jgi:hypothetical protein
MRRCESLVPVVYCGRGRKRREVLNDGSVLSPDVGMLLAADHAGSYVVTREGASGLERDRPSQKVALRRRTVLVTTRIPDTRR